MEKFSSLDRIVGKVSEEEKIAIFNKRQKRFETKDIEGIKTLEKEKTPEELKILLEVNEATNELRRKYGLTDFNIPEENMHLIRKEEWKTEGEIAVSLPEMERILLRERERRIQFAQSAFHEETHLKSYNALQKMSDCDKVEKYRHGLRIFPRSQEKLDSIPEGYFHDLNEGVTEELTRRYIMSQVDNPLYSDEFAETKELREFAKKNGMRELLDEEIFSLYRVPGSNEIRAEKFAYKNFRVALYQIRKTLAEKHPDKFKNSDEVLDVFARAMFTGKMFELSSLMEETFGKGTMRAIGTP